MDKTNLKEPLVDKGSSQKEKQINTEEADIDLATCQQKIFQEALFEAQPRTIKFDELEEQIQQDQIIKDGPSHQNLEKAYDNYQKQNLKKFDQKKLDVILNKEFDKETLHIKKQIKPIPNEHKNLISLSMFNQDWINTKKESKDEIDYSKEDNFINKIFDLLIQNDQQENKNQDSINNQTEKEQDQTQNDKEKEFIQKKNQLYKPIFHKFQNDSSKETKIEKIYQEIVEHNQTKDQESYSNIHRSLYCTGIFNSEDQWIVEANKQFFQLNQDSQTDLYESSLKLTLKIINKKNQSKQILDLQLNKFSEKTINQIKKKNSEWLFNQIQIRDELHFFSIENIQPDNKEFKLIFNKLCLSEFEHQSKFEHEVVDEFKFSKEELELDDKEEVLGAIIIPKALQNFNHPQEMQSDYENLFFAIISGDLEQNSNTINYHIINYSKPNKVIKKINISLNQNSLDEYDLVIIQTDAIQMFKQFLLKKIIKKNKYNQVIKSIESEAIQLQNDLQEAFLNTYQISQSKKSQLTLENKNDQSNPTNKKQSKCSHNKSNMIVCGYIHNQDLFQIHDFEIISKENSYDKKSFLIEEEIKQSKQLLQDIFKMISLENTCNEASFNTQEIRPDVSRKMLCRGQLELFKSMIAYKETKKDEGAIKANQESNDNGKPQNSTNDKLELKQQQSSYVSKKTQKKLEIYKELNNMSCACLFDLIKRQLVFLIYDKNHPDFKILMEINLRNYEQLYCQSTDNKPLCLNMIKPSNYNKMFQEIYKHDSQQSYIHKFFVSNKFDNVSCNLSEIYCLKNNELWCNSDKENTVKNLRSNINIYFEKGIQDNQTNNSDDGNEKHIKIVVSDDDNDHKKFIYNIVQINKNNISTSNQSIKDLSYVLDPKEEEKKTHIQFNLKLNETEYYKFKFENSYLLLQNVMTIEDDRQEVPIVSIGRDFQGIQFSFWRNQKIVAITPLHIQGKSVLDSMNNNMNKKNYQRVIQFCASSDIEIVKYEDMDHYFVQNYTIVVHYMKQSRFSMFEYQVKWIPIKDKKNEDDQFDIQISLIKLREVVFQESKNHQCIQQFIVVPLYEQLPLKNKDQNVYKITGVQLIMQLENNQYTYVDFRNLLDSNIYEVDDQLKEINYSKRLIYARTKRIHRFHLKGVFVETQFKHTEEKDLLSEYINYEIFNNWESFQILKQANQNLLNSLPIDIIGLTNVPQIMFEYQFKKNSSDDDVQEISDVKKLLSNNYKKFFNTCEVLDGQVIFDNFATRQVNRIKKKNLQSFIKKLSMKKDTDNETVTITKRDPYHIKMFLKTLNEQQSNEYFDFIFIKDLQVPVFALSLLDRVLINDEKSTRYQLFKHEGLLMDGKDVIQIDLNQESIMMKPLDADDNMIVDIYLGQLFNDNKFTENKYSQIMRIMAPALEKEEFQSNQFFQFFEYIYEDNIDDLTEKVNANKSYDFLIDHDTEKQIKEQECQNQIKFAQFLPDNLQDLIDRYTNEKLQVFCQQLSGCHWNLIYDNNEYKAFKLLKSLYNPIGSKFEVLATNINFQPYILGMKINLLRKGVKENLAKVKQIQFDHYDLANLVQKIISLTEGNIEDQKVIRDIIDYQFRSTRRFYYIQFVIYVVFYFFPFWWQLDKEDANLVYPTTIICLIVQIIFILYEFLQLLANNTELTFNLRIIKKLLVDHFSTLWNCVDAINFILFILFFNYRWNHADRSLLPTFDDELKDIESQVPYLKNQQFIQKFQMDDQSGFKFVPILNISLLMISFFKALALLRCNQEFGELLQLVLTCFKDVQYFIFFFLAWVFIFSKLFQITGAEYGDDEYERIPMLSFYLQTFKASLGETAAPETLYWDQLQQYTRVIKGLDDETATWTYPMVMIYIIWFIWFLNLMVNMVILLNFLIAIISTSYDKVIQNRLIYAYKHKSDLNYEYYQSLRFFRRFPVLFKSKFFEKWIKLNEFDLMCIVSSHTEMQIDFNEIRGMTYGLKVFMKSQLQKMQTDFNRRFQNINFQHGHSITAIQNVSRQLDEKFASLQEIKNLVEKNQENNQPDQGKDKLDKIQDNINSFINKQNKDIKSIIDSVNDIKQRMESIENQQNNISNQINKGESELVSKHQNISHEIESEKQKREDMQQDLFNEMKELKDQMNIVIEQLGQSQKKDMDELKNQMGTAIEQLASNQKQETQLLKDQMVSVIQQLALAQKQDAAYDDAEDKIEEQNDDQNVD